MPLDLAQLSPLFGLFGGACMLAGAVLALFAGPIRHRHRHELSPKSVRLLAEELKRLKE